MTKYQKHFVLFSGGLDSTVVLYRAITEAALLNSKGYAEYKALVEAVGIDYGQRHAKELRAAQKIADDVPVPYSVLKMPDLLAGVMLTDNRPIPEQSYSDLPVGMSPTYVPFRNGLMLSMLAAHAQKWVMANPKDRVAVLHIGSHAEDAENDAYPDCSVEFMREMGRAINLGTYGQVDLVTPLINMKKAEVIALGSDLKVPFADTWSCYKGGDKHCGRCMTCNARKAGFKAAGVIDPTEYEAIAA